MNWSHVIKVIFVFISALIVFWLIEIFLPMASAAEVPPRKVEFDLPGTQREYVAHAKTIDKLLPLLRKLYKYKQERILETRKPLSGENAPRSIQEKELIRNEIMPMVGELEHQIGIPLVRTQQFAWMQKEVFYDDTIFCNRFDGYRQFRK